MGRGWIWMSTWVAGCAARGLVPEGDAAGTDGDTSAHSDGVTTDAETTGDDIPGTGIFTVTDTDVDIDDDSSTGAPIECVEPVAPAITVELFPGEDPDEADGGVVVRELECEMQGPLPGEVGTTLGMECDVSPTGYVGAVVLLTLDAAIAIPAALDYPAQVLVRVNTYRDDDVGEFPWLRADHAAIYRDGELILGVASGSAWPATADGEADPEFWAPLAAESLWTDCPAPALECHARTQSALGLVLGEEAVVAHPYSLVQLGDYDVHVGEMVGADSPACGEPAYGWVSFAIARAR